ncbi:MAG: hypothetical protein IKB61_00250, partial [Elusimicrobiaceae bacterium]|nr:hypothetical protein [Elusimicrobiaceae bacterium]
AARDKDGKTVYVPSNMKYKDWYNKFIDNSVKENPVALLYVADILQKDKDGRYKFDDFEIKKETERAYLIKREHFETWIPKKVVNKDGYINKSFSQEMLTKIRTADIIHMHESVIGKYKFWRPPGKRERIYLADGSYAERFLKRRRDYAGGWGDGYDYTGEYVFNEATSEWEASGGLAAEKIKEIRNMFQGVYNV